jgi:hypothetical protein
VSSANIPCREQINPADGSFAEYCARAARVQPGISSGAFSQRSRYRRIDEVRQRFRNGRKRLVVNVVEIGKGTASTGGGEWDPAGRKAQQWEAEMADGLVPAVLHHTPYSSWASRSAGLTRIMTGKKCRRSESNRHVLADTGF